MSGLARGLRLALAVAAALLVPCGAALAQNRGVAPDPVGPRPSPFTLPPDLEAPTVDNPLPNSRQPNRQAPGREAGNGKGVGLGVGGAAGYRPGPGRTLNGGVASGLDQPRGPGYLSARPPKASVGQVRE